MKSGNDHPCITSICALSRLATPTGILRRTVIRRVHGTGIQGALLIGRVRVTLFDVAIGRDARRWLAFRTGGSHAWGFRERSWTANRLAKARG
jgi:hypothetical protein